MAGLLVVVLLFMPAVATAADEEAIGPTVKGITLEGLYSIDEEEFLYLLGIRPGAPLDPVAVRDGIKRAFLKGIFEDISVETEGQDRGHVKITVRERDFIERIKIKGNRRVPADVIKGGLGLREGGLMRHDLLAEKRGNLIDLLRRKGFASPDVRIEVEGAGRVYRVNLIVEITEGEPLRIEKIIITGRPAREVLSLLSLRPGDVYDRLELERDLRGIGGHYREEGYLNPVVGPYGFEDGVLSLRVEPGRRLKIKIKGNLYILSTDLYGLMPFFEAQAIRDDLIEEAVHLMLALYHEKGFSFARIVPVLTEEGDEAALNFYVFEGGRVLVKSINFEGISIPDKKLKAIMALKERGVFNPGLPDSDARKIREFYMALGHKDAVVGSPRVRIDRNRAEIEIKVQEGGKVVVAGLGFEGVGHLPERELYDVLNIKRGDPYNEVDISEARRRVLTVFRSRGFPGCGVEVKREFTEEGVRVVFRVDEGERLFFGKTVVLGNGSTQLKVIQREFRCREGMPFDHALLMETRRRLYRLGLFSSVNVDAFRSESGAMDIVVALKEAKAGTVEIGLGYGEYERYRGFFDISYRNLFGMNRQVSFRAELNSLSNRLILNFKGPWFLNSPMESRTFLLREDRKEKNIDTGEVRYRIIRHTASTGLERMWRKRTTMNFYYEFSLVETSDVQPDVELSREDTGTLSISSLKPGIIYDSRDNPFDPQEGVSAGLTVKAASALLLSETDFLKATVRLSGYRRLTRGLVLALSLRGGAAQGLRDTEELPLVERFFLGGRNTVRGYEQDTLGPKGDAGTPIGGNAFMLMNLELRHRLLKNWRVVTFLDTGNVWERTGDLDLDELKYTAGMGLQYNTPVGPMRLDYGYKLQREPGESSGELYFSLGLAF